MAGPTMITPEEITMLTEATYPYTLPPRAITTTAELATEAIRKYRKQLNLTHWDVRFSERPLKGDKARAEMAFRDASRVAVINLHPDVVTGDDIAACVVHELAHLVLKDYTVATNNVMAKLGDTGLGMMDFLDGMEERICETIAFALTGFRFFPTGKYERKCFAVFDEEAA